MVQITQERMVELRKAMEKLEDFKIDCGPIHAETPDETISIEWTDDVSDVNEGRVVILWLFIVVNRC